MAKKKFVMPKIEVVKKGAEPQELKDGGNTGLPFGLCKKYGIAIGKNWTPKDAWDALKGKTGKSPDDFYKELGGSDKINLEENKIDVVDANLKLGKDKVEEKEVRTKRKDYGQNEVEPINLEEKPNEVVDANEKLGKDKVEDKKTDVGKEDNTQGEASPIELKDKPNEVVDAKKKAGLVDVNADTSKMSKEELEDFREKLALSRDKYYVGYDVDEVKKMYPDVDEKYLPSEEVLEKFRDEYEITRNPTKDDISLPNYSIRKNIEFYINDQKARENHNPIPLEHMAYIKDRMRDWSQFAEDYYTDEERKEDREMMEMAKQEGLTYHNFSVFNNLSKGLNEGDATILSEGDWYKFSNGDGSITYGKVKKIHSTGTRLLLEKTFTLPSYRPYASHKWFDDLPHAVFNQSKDLDYYRKTYKYIKERDEARKARFA